MVAKRMRELRIARMAIRNGANYKSRADTQRETTIPQTALPVVQVSGGNRGQVASMAACVLDHYTSPFHLELVRVPWAMQGAEAMQMAERVQGRRLKRLRTLSRSITGGRTAYSLMDSHSRVRPQRNSDGDMNKVVVHALEIIVLSIDMHEGSRRARRCGMIAGLHNRHG